MSGLSSDDDGGPQGWVTTELGMLEPAPVLRIHTSGSRHDVVTWVAPPTVGVTRKRSGAIEVVREGGATRRLL
ncbi:MAG: hypothetical protein GWM91_20385, partial [Actinobacteria bacterium]|nr:hypothetical protein [Actinomycetota bacterium]NIX52613.1 hypothetical protein [Actinomycetota bacterium]